MSPIFYYGLTAIFAIFAAFGAYWLGAALARWGLPSSWLATKGSRIESIPLTLATQTYCTYCGQAYSGKQCSACDLRLKELLRESKEAAQQPKKKTKHPSMPKVYRSIDDEWTPGL